MSGLRAAYDALKRQVFDIMQRTQTEKPLNLRKKDSQSVQELLQFFFIFPSRNKKLTFNSLWHLCLDLLG